MSLCKLHRLDASRTARSRGRAGSPRKIDAEGGFPAGGMGPAKSPCGAVQLVFRPPFMEPTAKIMKTPRPIFHTRGMLAAVLAASAPLAVPQTVDLSTGTILDSNTSGTVIAGRNLAPTRLSASLLPIGNDNPASGEIVFVMAGGAVSVVGRIVGLEPDKRYQAVLQFPVVAVTGADGESRPVAPGAGRQGTRRTASRAPNATAITITPDGPPNETDLAMVVADASGAANLSTLIPNKDLSAPPAGILGCSLVVKRAPPLDSREERTPVASGIIVSTHPPPPPPPSP